MKKKTRKHCHEHIISRYKIKFISQSNLRAIYNSNNVNYFCVKKFTLRM